MNKRYMLWTLVLLLMVMIIRFSGDPAVVSSGRSRSVLAWLTPAIRLLEEWLRTELIESGRLHHYLRKLAHIALYFALTLALLQALAESGFRGQRAFRAAWIAATAFSVADEYYQTFVPGRGGRILDVGIDQVGIVLALIVALFYCSLRRSGVWSQRGDLGGNANRGSD